MVPKLRIRRPTRQRAEAFADEWINHTRGNGDLFDAFTASGLIEWPEGEAAQSRYQAIEDEILERVREAVREPIAEALLTVARDVLARERRKV